MAKHCLLIFALSLLFFSCNKECTNEFGECPEKQLEEDLVIIESYVADNNLDTEVHPSGLHYFIVTEGDGDTPNTGQKVAVDYVGRFLDGRVFDTSIDSVARAEGIFDENRSYAPFEFTLGVGRVIAGWDIGIALLQQGSKAQFIIPSYLAYGATGADGIAPNTILLFEVELKNIKF